LKKPYKKYSFPVHRIRRFLEPGPIVLVTSHHKGKFNIMTMGWYTLLEFDPSLIGCMIVDYNHTHELIKKSGECVINLPAIDLLPKVIAIGNCHGNSINKFEEFSLTPSPATDVKAPLIKECYANFECRIYDKRLLKDYNFFIFEVIKAHVPKTPKHPKTVHYTGDGVFMFSGKHAGYRKKFRPENL
jgi:flavin reductase (DIM6/NTAB) family NADH-FMN oxidoreductase RutF